MLQSSIFHASHLTGVVHIGTQRESSELTSPLSSTRLVTHALITTMFRSFPSNLMMYCDHERLRSLRATHYMPDNTIVSIFSLMTVGRCKRISFYSFATKELNLFFVLGCQGQGTRSAQAIQDRTILLGFIIDYKLYFLPETS